MTSKLRRGFVAVGLMAATAVGSVATAPAATSAPDIPINWTVDATTHIAGLNQDTTITGGTFVGSVDLATGNITADLTLPDATSDVKLLGIPLATATFRVAPTGPATGHVDLATMTVTISNSFNIKIPSLKPKIFPINLVGNNCGTAEPITLDMSGPVDLVNGSTLSGEFTIPKFSNCGIATFALSLLASGPGNTFTATARPAA
jgi:hypothetical protein